MYITEKVEISQADFNEMKGDFHKVDEYVGWRARFSAYPPAGYGYFKPMIFQEGNKYYCSWRHNDNCDLLFGADRVF